MGETMEKITIKTAKKDDIGDMVKLLKQLFEIE